MGGGGEMKLVVQGSFGGIRRGLVGGSGEEFLVEEEVVMG